MTHALVTLVSLAILPIGLLLLLPTISELWSAATVLWRRIHGAPASASPASHQRLLILLAAHDEELLISHAVRSLVAMRRVRCDYDVYVIADNCADRTAELAVSEGACVLIRRDEIRRGKPWALDWAMSELPVDRYDAVVIVDADSIVDPDFADALASRGPLRGKTVQSYSAISNASESWLTVLGALLVSMRYDGQFVLKRRAGLNCPLATGWCVGTDLLARGGWAPTSLTETWELYARYTVLGARIDFAPAAIVRSQEARSLSQGAPQRRRWQAGKSIVFKKYWRQILMSDRIGVRQKLDAFGELAAVGPVLHAVLVLPVAGLLAASGMRIAEIVAAVLVVSLAPTVFWTAVAWAHQPNRSKVLMALLRLPVYAIWRLAVAAQAFGTGRRGIWHRSPRHQFIKESTS